MTADWKDALASLTGLPEGNNQSQTDNQRFEEPATKHQQQTTLHIFVEKKGRGGKTATIIDGFQCPDDEIDEIARDLRKRLGTGGSTRGGEILIQGDRRNDVAAILREKGFKVKA